MILDTSAMIAIVTREPEADLFKEKIEAATNVFMSAASVVEACMVLRGKLDSRAESAFWQVVAEGKVELVPFDQEQARHAIAGFATFGKGRHPAKLNLGDCYVYGLAKAKGLPILFKGTDFAMTDALIA